MKLVGIGEQAHNAKAAHEEKMKNTFCYCAEEFCYFSRLLGDSLVLRPSPFPGYGKDFG